MPSPLTRNYVLCKRISLKDYKGYINLKYKCGYKRNLAKHLKREFIAIDHSQWG